MAAHRLSRGHSCGCCRATTPLGDTVLISEAHREGGGAAAVIRSPTKCCVIDSEMRKRKEG